MARGAVPFGGDRPRDPVLAHAIGGPYLALEWGRKIMPLLLVGAEPIQYLHIAGVWRGAVEHFRGEVDMPHDLREGRKFAVAETGAIF